MGRIIFKKMSEYKVAISFNGNGEFCLRDVEAMGLGMVTVRPLLKTKFHNSYLPGTHFIQCGPPSNMACSYGFPNSVEDMVIKYSEEIDKIAFGKC